MINPLAVNYIVCNLRLYVLFCSGSFPAIAILVRKRYKLLDAEDEVSSEWNRDIW